MLLPGPRDTTETVDRIFRYLANDPPRPQRMVLDEDWSRMGQERLAEELSKQLTLVRYLVRENGRLVKAAKGNGRGIHFKEWRHDEHIEMAEMSDLKDEEIRMMSRDTLLHKLGKARRAREDLLNDNETIIRQMK